MVDHFLRGFVRFLSGLLFLSSPVAASAVSWTSIGPDGGPVLSISRAPGSTSTLYASTGRTGVFRSFDDGESWQRDSDGLTAVTGSIAASSNGAVLVATSSGLFRSVDQGTSWLPAPGLPAAPATQVAADPRFPATVYASILTGTGILYASRDAGTTWTRTSYPGAPGVIAIDPRSSTIYADRLKSTDGGATWTPLGAASDNPIAAPTLTGYAIDPASPQTIYASAAVTPYGAYFTLSGGVFLSVDGGATFVPASNGLSASPNDPASCRALAIGPAGQLYAGCEPGLFVSTDRAASWRAVRGLRPEPVEAIQVGSDGEILIGTAGRGLFASRDGGTTWVPRSHGIRAMSISEVALDPRLSSTIWVAEEDGPNGIFVSRDGGATWRDVGSGLPSTERVRSLAVDPLSSDVVFAGTFDIRNGGLGNIYRTRDGGASWQAAGNDVGGAPGDPGLAAQRLVFDPVDSNRIYATLIDHAVRSKDGGDTWLDTGSRYVQSVAVDPENPALVYTTGTKSADRGETWSPLGIFGLSVAVGPGGVVFVGTANGVFSSTDHGQTFGPANRGIESVEVRTLAVDWIRGTLYAASSYGRAFPDLSPGQEDAGIFVSADGGASWGPASQGLPIRVIPAIAVDPTTSVAYAGTQGAGLFRSATTAPSCDGDPQTLCFGGGRFRAQAVWKTSSATGAGRALPLTSDAGAFWFFSANNLELVIKVVDGTPVNGKFWVFGAGLTDVEYDLAITDTTTGTVWTRHNSPGSLASFADTSAF